MLKPCSTDWAARLAAALDGEATDDERQALAAHLAQCPACRGARELSRCDAQDARAALLARGASADFAQHVTAAIQATGMAPAGAPKLIPPPTPAPRRRSFGWGEILALGAIFALLSAVLFPTFAKSREKARQTSCINNQKQIITALLLYAQDHDEQLPRASEWIDAILEYAGRDMKLLDCPSSAQTGNDYALNIDLDRRKLGDFPQPAGVVATFDAKDGRPAYHRHLNGLVVSYLDGHVSWERQPEKSERLRMTTPPVPPAPPPGPQGGTKPAPSPTIAPPTHNYGLADKLQIAYTASVGLESTDVQRALEGAELLFRQYDGFVLKSDYARGEDDEPATATVNGRVPAGRLGGMLVELGKLGELTTRAVNGEDLTAAHLEYLEKLDDLAGAQGQLNAIARHARGTGTALNVEERRYGTAKAATGLRVDAYRLKSRVTLAEVSVSIREQAKKPVPGAVNPIGAAAGASARALGAFLKLLAGILVSLLIWTPIWAPILGIALYLRRRQPRKDN